MGYAHKQVSMSVVMSDFLNGEEAHWELRQPKPGMRHNQEPKWVAHRFPIKGGKTNSQMMIGMMEQNNAFYQHLLKNQKFRLSTE